MLGELIFGPSLVCVKLLSVMNVEAAEVQHLQKTLLSQSPRVL